VRPDFSYFGCYTNLLRLAVETVQTTAAAELVKLHAAGVVALVLGAGIVTLFALGAGEVDDDAVLFLCHGFFPCSKFQVQGSKRMT
jgi:hypothetical protein